MRLTVRCFGVMAAVAILLAASGAAAGVVTHHYSFPEPVIEVRGDYYRITMDGAWSFGDPGEPVLPLVGARLLVPPGEVVSEVRITPGRKVVLGDGYLLEPGQPQYPLSFTGKRIIAKADYAPGATYPSELHSDPVFGRYRGYGIANLALSPVEYEADSGTVSYYTSMDVEIVTEPDADGLRGVERMIAHDDATLSRLSGMIDNPAATLQYGGIDRVSTSSRVLNPTLAYNYIIVTSDAWDGYLDEFVTFRTQRGQKVGVFTREWIVANYTGTDTQTKIRNFIIDAYGTWTPDYVLLVGDGEPSDSNGIPARGFYCNAYGEIDEGIASDLYYSCLDGNWNSDGDSYYGEIGEEDFYPEVAIGRVACSGSADVTNFVTKTMRYLDEPIVDECSEALMVGELLWTYPDIYGGTYKDEVMNGGSYNGYTTTGFPPSMNVGTLYERDYVWSITTLINEMETGMNIVNHLGHCNVDWFMKMTTSNIPSFDNDGTVHSLNFCYSQGCYGGSFDNRTTSFTYGGDCFSERFACDDDGAVAIVTNTRYGWGDTGGTNGSSQYFDREFFDAIFAEGIYPLGEVNDDSKIDVLWNINFGANRWCYYELTLFGDPAMPLWTADPIAMNVTHNATVMVGQPDFEISVSDGARGVVEGATVTIYTDDYAVYDTGTTNASGYVMLHPNATGVGTLNVKVTANNHLISNTTANIIPTAGVYLAMAGESVSDDTTGESSGNGDGYVGPGETIELSTTVGNFGTDMAYGVTATLSTGSGRVSMLDDQEDFGDIAASEEATCLDDFEFSVSPDAQDGEVISFTLTMSDATRATWESNFNLIVHAPDLAYEDHVVTDPQYGGNENGCPEPAEVISISVTLENTGTGVATGVTGTLTSSDPYVYVGGDEASVVFMNPDGSATLQPDFTVTILPSAPVDHDIVFDLDISADWGYSSSGQFTVRTVSSSFADDIESGVGLWTHSSVTGGFQDQWHVETYRYHSSGHSWKFGGSGSAGYTDSCDGALVMKPVCVGTDGSMTFWHSMYAEEESSTSAWDCGLVEISTDGGATWNVLYPNGGYSHYKNSNTANPLPEGTPCWSGSFGWRQETFDLSSYENSLIQIRFRFASDGYVTEEGWYVDDINLTSTSPPTGVDGEDETPRVFALRQNAPNPFNPVTVIQYQLPKTEHVRIDVFNVAGKLVTTLVDEQQDAGHKAVTWDGTDSSGERVASGVYLYRMEAGEHVSRKAMVLLK
ncbi:MAG: T9SS type A sorting domain-containing protein [Candidatus Eisenbacteria bacterium]|nr:T9SS type A sorting domain-containing protein [Candidatus Eisenbacteria bacterium]